MARKGARATPPAVFTGGVALAQAPALAAFVLLAIDRRGYYEHLPWEQLCREVAIRCTIASLHAGHLPLVLLTLP